LLVERDQEQKLASRPTNKLTGAEPQAKRPVELVLGSLLHILSIDCGTIRRQPFPHFIEQNNKRRENQHEYISTY
jgi:hypothetical protein